ncbi:protein-export chaperone SecB [Acidomonas methanolica]|uniref:protein-export chaperone SecB n=1 Tax=Acidomonas methanolica TaxID=437 RepID=UPI00211A603D|nr:protein-export chaperone SecB [Acidomonas methanolica]
MNAGTTLDSGKPLAESVAGGLSHPSPGLVIGSQYLRSVSFQTPQTPSVFASLQAPPHVRLVVDVNARQLSETDLNFEVTLVLRAEGQTAVPDAAAPEPPVAYEAMAAYAGLFVVGPQWRDRLEEILLIEAPRQLFPAARAVLLGLVREAGFQVANIQPVDFVALWHARRSEATQG